MVRFLLVALCLLPGVAPLSGVTMQQLSLDDLAVKSTAIVRGRVVDQYTALAGPTVYTHYRVAITDSWKGAGSGTIDVVLPGGSASGIRQTYPGVPQLTVGREYLLYLWTSSSGMTMPTGFNQGIFNVTVTSDKAATIQVSREASAETMLNAKGVPVQDKPVTMRLAEAKVHVAAALARAGALR